MNTGGLYRGAYTLVDLYSEVYGSVLNSTK